LSIKYPIQKAKSTQIIFLFKAFLTQNPSLTNQIYTDTHNSLTSYNLEIRNIKPENYNSVEEYKQALKLHIKKIAPGKYSDIHYTAKGKIINRF
jgi:hypothetical protein